MNKKGFTLIELLATIVIIALIMSIILPSASRMSRDNKETIYHSYEDMMAEYAQVSEYKDQYYINLNDLEELGKVKRECKGYVLIDHDTTPISYISYISCGDDYETEGYIDIDANVGSVIDIPTCLPNVVYNGKQQSLIQPNLTYKLSNNMRRNIGKQNVIASLSNKLAYEWSDGTKEDKIINNCEIKKRQIILTADDKSIRYGNAAPEFTYTVTGGISGENPFIGGVTLTVKNSGGTTVTGPNYGIGTYTINPSATVSDNYSLVYGNPGTFRVLASMFTLTLNNGGATTAGTTKIYEKYNEGWYSDSGFTTAITSITVPTKTGNTFGGYYDSQDGNGTRYIDASGGILASSTSIDGDDATAYAKWTPITCTITLNNQSATTAGTATIYQKYGLGWYSNSGATTSITSITVPAKTGYTFGGYYTATGGGGGQVINASGNITAANTICTTSTKTIYAKWTAKTLTLTLNNHDATTAGTATIYEKYATGWYSNSGATTSITTITKPAKTGYTFGGYYTAENGGGTQIIDSSGTITAANTKFTANTTLYAKWTANIYTITLNNQSATTAGTATIYEKYATGWYNNSGATTSITTITKPVRTGYTFGGYYTAENGGGTQIIDSSGTITAANTKFTANTTLYAKWTANIYTITLNNQSATTAGTATMYEKYASGYYSNSGATTSMTTITKPVRTGYTFGGYYTATNGGGDQVINASGTITAANTKFTANATIYAKWTKNTYTININKNGSACTDCSGYTIHLSTSSSSDTNSYSATTTTASSVTISLASEAKHYIWIGKDQNHKSTMVYTGVAIEGLTASAAVNYYTLTMSGTNMATLTLNGSSVTSGNSVVVAGTSGNSHTLGGTATSGYTFTAWSKVSGTVTFGDTTAIGSALKVSASSSIKATAADKTAPTVTLTSTATLKKASQTATLKCSDGVGITAYYWGTTEPTAATDVKTTTAADLTSLKSSSGLTKTIDTNGAFWLACRDSAGNYAKQRIIMRKYIVKNMLVTYSGTLGTYDTTNYAQASTGTYYVPNGTELTVSSIYTIPTGSRSGRYRGYSTGAPSTTAVSSLTSGNPTISANTTYTFWFSRNVVYFKYKTNGGNLKATTKTTDGNTTYTWTVDSDGFINRSVNGAAATVVSSSYRYGVSTINLTSPVNPNYILITKAGKWVTTDKEWVCESGCATASLVISEASTQAFDTSTMCNITNADCTIVVKPRFVNCQAGYYCPANAARTSCGTNKSSLAGATSSSDCFVSVVNFAYSGSTKTYTIPRTGNYLLEVWGAQGGDSLGDYVGGKGGYSKGTKKFNEGDKIYVSVGGKGGDCGSNWVNGDRSGGWNGGGNSWTDDVMGCPAAGGGATHMATATGVLSSLSGNKSAILLVAGGGGGAFWYDPNGAGERPSYAGSGGYGGGTSGQSRSNGHGSSAAGTQSSGCAFGKGCLGSCGSGECRNKPGGGGGYYGGKAFDAVPGAGGSGYVSSSLTGASTAGNSREDDGYARITWKGV